MNSQNTNWTEDEKGYFLCAVSTLAFNTNTHIYVLSPDAVGIALSGQLKRPPLEIASMMHSLLLVLVSNEGKLPVRNYGMETESQYYSKLRDLARGYNMGVWGGDWSLRRSTFFHAPFVLTGDIITRLCTLVNQVLVELDIPLNKLTADMLPMDKVTTEFRCTPHDVSALVSTVRDCCKGLDTLEEGKIVLIARTAIRYGLDVCEEIVLTNPSLSIDILMEGADGQYNDDRVSLDRKLLIKLLKEFN